MQFPVPGRPAVRHGAALGVASGRGCASGSDVDLGDVERYNDAWRSATPDERLTRNGEVHTRVAQLSGYSHRSQPQDDELGGGG